MTNHLRTLRLIRSRTQDDDVGRAMDAAIEALDPLRDRALLHAGRYHLAYDADAPAFAAPDDFEEETIANVNKAYREWRKRL